MNSQFGLSLFFLLAVLLSRANGVILSWEESKPGKIDYRFFYVDIPPPTNGVYQKPYFALVNGDTYYSYGTLGSLDCSPFFGTGSVAAFAMYWDSNGDGFKEWVCTDSNALPFIHNGPSTPNPPNCEQLGIPAIWNETLKQWFCGDQNQILSSSFRDTTEPCANLDFAVYFEGLGVRCASPSSIDPSKTNVAKESEEEEEMALRVDPNHDVKWVNFATTTELTGVSTRGWETFKWTPDLQYDVTQTYSQRASPPIVLPFNSQLIAATAATWNVNGYNWVIQLPGATDSLTIVFSKLSASLGVTNFPAVTFDTVLGTTGQALYPLSTVNGTTCVPGETFVASITSIHWSALTSQSSRLAVSLNLWIQTTQSFV